MLTTAKLRWLLTRFRYSQFKILHKNQGLNRKKGKRAPSPKQFIKFWDSQGIQGMADNISYSDCSCNPPKDLGISGLEGTLKGHSFQTLSVAEFPLKPPQQVANPHICLNASNKGKSSPLLDSSDCPSLCWWWAPREKEEKSNNCPV